MTAGIRVWVLTFLLPVPCFSQVSMAKVNQRTLDVVIIGGTGDLAKRYLWKGFFRLFQKQYNVTDGILLYGTGRTEVSDAAFRQIVSQSIRCNDVDGGCLQNRQRFVMLCKYKKVNNDMDYKKLCTDMNSNSSNIIFYLSVPPVAYGSILQSIARHCDILNTTKDYKFAFEKPFGSDLKSAIALSNLLVQYLKEEQIYRVDHFLSDSTISRISDFRINNPKIEHLMNHRYIKKFEVVASETVGCQGRTSYYDKSGILRDMLQNHLTEVLCLVTKELDETKSRLSLLKNTETVRMKDVHLAQYEDYPKEVFNETERKHSSTATFARVKLRSKHSRWRNVLIWLTSGKMMKGKNMFARIVFKQSASSQPTFKGCSAIPQIAFVRQHSRLNSSAILVSHSLPISKQYSPPGWTKTKNFHDLSIFGEKGNCFLAFVPNTTIEHAYIEVVANLFYGNREDFVATGTLLESWRIWSTAVSVSDNLQFVATYRKGSTLNTILKSISRPLFNMCYILNILLCKCDVNMVAG